MSLITQQVNLPSIKKFGSAITMTTPTMLIGLMLEPSHISTTVSFLQNYIVPNNLFFGGCMAASTHCILNVVSRPILY